MPPAIQSDVFQITRAQLSHMGTRQYVRRLWWVFVGIPVFGILAFLIGPTPLVRYLGLFALVWPFTIPARSVIATWGPAKRLLKPSYVTLEDGVLYFHSVDETAGMKLPLANVLRVESKSGFYVIETRRYSFALIPQSAFKEGAKEAFEAALKEHVEAAAI